MYLLLTHAHPTLSHCPRAHSPGGRKSNGTCPEHHAKGAGGLLRHILQELERVGIVEMSDVKGRRITPAGQRDLDLIAGRIRMSRNFA